MVLSTGKTSETWVAGKTSETWEGVLKTSETSSRASATQSLLLVVKCGRHIDILHNPESDESANSQFSKTSLQVPALNAPAFIQALDHTHSTNVTHGTAPTPHTTLVWLGGVRARSRRIARYRELAGRRTRGCTAAAQVMPRTPQQSM